VESQLHLDKRVKIVDLASERRARVASTAVSKQQSRQRKLSKREAAKKIVCLLEQHMEDRKLSEEEKNFKVGKFAARLDEIIERHAKR